jgi:hypothetical protein
MELLNKEIIFSNIHGKKIQSTIKTITDANNLKVSVVHGATCCRISGDKFENIMPGSQIIIANNIKYLEKLICS